MEFSFVFTVRDPKITEWRLFVQDDYALEAAGLSEVGQITDNELG